MNKNTIGSYPLAWPVGYPRTKRPKPSLFDTSEADARDGLLNELRRLGARRVILSTNIETYRRGGREIPYANQRVEDKGVAVYFELKGEQRVLACDRWNKIADNYQAIRKTVEALRGLDRWGVSDMLNRVFSGFKALPANGSTAQGLDTWWNVLGVSRDASPNEIRRAYRKRARETHPDAGGSNGAFLRVQEAYAAALPA